MVPERVGETLKPRGRAAGPILSRRPGWPHFGTASGLEAGFTGLQRFRGRRLAFLAEPAVAEVLVLHEHWDTYLGHAWE